MTPSDSSTGSAGPPEGSAISIRQDTHKVREHLAQILAGASFARATRQAALMSFIVEKTLAGLEHEINEYSLAELLGRPTGFDPASDSTVRVAARRLRSRLEAYYRNEGSNAPVRIVIPAGSYIPVFSIHPESPDNTATAPVPPPGGRRVHIGSLVLAALSVAAVGILSIRFIPHPMLGRSVPGAKGVVQITSYPGRQSQPSLSPDKSKIAFSWDGDDGRNYDIYVKAIDGPELIRLTRDPGQDQAPQWSPNGKFIAFQRMLPDMNQAIYVIPSAGGPERRITTVNTSVAGLAWTADSGSLIIADSPPGVPLGLFLVSVTTGQRRQLTAYESDIQPALSPDGRSLAFVRLGTNDRKATLGILPLTSAFLPAGPVQFPALALPDKGPAAGVAGSDGIALPAWSVDGQSLLFLRYTGSGPRAFRFSPGDAHLEEVAELGDHLGSVLELGANRYLFTRSRQRAFVTRVAADDAHGSAAQPFGPVSLPGEFNPEISPSGAKFAYISRTLRDGPEPGSSLFVADADGANPVRIAAPGIDIRDARWSPDSTEIVFSGWANSVSGVYLASLTNPTARKLNVGEGRVAHPFFSHNAKWIYFSSDRSGFPQIWRIPAGGGDPEAVTQEASNYAEESTDGETLYYASRALIRRMSLADRQSTTFAADTCGEGFRVTASGVYVLERGPSGNCSRVRFRPFSVASPQFLFTVEGLGGFCPGRSVSELLVSITRKESSIEAAGFD